MRWVLCMGMMVWSVSGWADFIVIDGERLEDVFIRETERHYYVQLPDEGRVRVVDKEDGDVEDVWISPDEAHRRVLHVKWEEANATLRGRDEREETFDRESAISNRRRPHVPLVHHNTPNTPLRSEDSTYSAIRGIVLDPIAQHVAADLRTTIRLRDVPLRDALNAILRPLGLDYRVEGHIVFVSTVHRLRHGSFMENLETRIYELEGAPASETLFKIVLQNPF